MYKKTIQTYPTMHKIIIRVPPDPPHVIISGIALTRFILWFFCCWIILCHESTT